MTFGEALKKLHIEEYGERIFASNSHGELFHLQDYFILAENIGSDEMAEAFREWFVDTVKNAEETWERPESVFQHIPKLLKIALEKK